MVVIKTAFSFQSSAFIPKIKPGASFKRLARLVVCYLCLLLAHKDTPGGRDRFRLSIP